MQSYPSAEGAQEVVRSTIIRRHSAVRGEMSAVCHQQSWFRDRSLSRLGGNVTQVAPELGGDCIDHVGISS